VGLETEADELEAGSEAVAAMECECQCRVTERRDPSLKFTVHSLSSF
jgi:hypothetical protein